MLGLEELGAGAACGQPLARMQALGGSGRRWTLSGPPRSRPTPVPRSRPRPLLPLTTRSGGKRAWVMRVMFSRENWKEQLNMRKSWKMAGQSRGQMSCCPLKVEMVMESVQKEQGCMPVKPPSMYLWGSETRCLRRRVSSSTRRAPRDWDHGTAGPEEP